MSGAFLLVVGPSGAGKDTLIAFARAELAGDPRFVFPRRVITRSKTASEDHDTIDQEGFERALTAGRFCLSWRAHGLCYGVPKAAAEEAHCGRVVLSNVSRTVVGEARRRFPRLFVLEITASPDVLAQRLAARGREDQGNLADRLRRSELVPEVNPDLVIENDGTVEMAGAKLVGFMRDVAIVRPGAVELQHHPRHEAAVR